MTVTIASAMHLNASRSLIQPCISDCILYLMQYLYDPGISRSAKLSVPAKLSVSEIQSIRVDDGCMEIDE